MNDMLNIVQNGDFDPIKMFSGDKNKFLEVKTAIESITNYLSKEACLNFILAKVLPVVFDLDVDDSIRDKMIILGLHFQQFANLSLLDTKEQDRIINEIEETYSKVIGDLRESNNPTWAKLWILVVKLCSEKLHTKLSLTNKLLRIIEYAFRNSQSLDQRFQAYDCWMELINNSSLNMDYMCTPKQIKLLMTPMKAKFTKMPLVTIKCCDTFIHLLDRMQNKATMCLIDFLEFCFGSLEDKEKTGRARACPEVCCKSTKVLIEVIGHSHDSSTNCLKSDEFTLKKPLITGENFSDFAEVLINSVSECCVLLNDWSQDQCSNSFIVKCLWGTLFQLIPQTSDEIKTKCYTQVNNLLKDMLEKSTQKEFLHLVLGNILELLPQDEFRDIVFNISLSLLWHVKIENCCFSVPNILKFVNSCLDGEDSAKFNKIVSNFFKSETKCRNPNEWCEIWCKCKIIVSADNMRNLTWPVRHFHEFKDTKMITSKWVKLFFSECKTENMKNIFILDISKIFMNDCTLDSNIVQFLELVSTETNHGKDFVAKLMKLFEEILVLPNLPRANIKKISSTILLYCRQNLYFYRYETNDEAIDKLCNCLQHLITIHKEYSILPELVSCLKAGQPRNLAKFSKHLMSFLESLLLNEDESTISSSIRKLIELLETKENETAALTNTRSLRIMNMANVTPKGKRLGTSTNNLKSHKASPLPLPRNKSSSPKGRKTNFSLFTNDDKSSDYVKIDTEVKINPDKLNEHQKEVLMRRREDIPALYEDLTWSSQGEDTFKSKIEKGTCEADTLSQIEEMSMKSISSDLNMLFNNSNNTGEESRKFSMNPKEDVSFSFDTTNDKTREQHTRSSPRSSKKDVSLLFDNNKTDEESQRSLRSNKDVSLLFDNTNIDEENQKSSPSSSPKKDMQSVQKDKYISKKLRHSIANVAKQQVFQNGNESFASEDDFKLENSEEEITEPVKEESTDLLVRKSKRQVKKRELDFGTALPTAMSSRKKKKDNSSKNIDNLLALIDKSIKETVKEEGVITGLEDGNQNTVKHKIKNTEPSHAIKFKKIVAPARVEEPSDDIYEFKVENESGDSKKIAKKLRKKGLILNGSDYVKKRKKPRTRETKEQKSSETITIVVSNSPNQTNESDKISDTTPPKSNLDIPPLTPTRRSRRKQSFDGIKNSEDLIESSQTQDIRKVKTISRSRSKSCENLEHVPSSTEVVSSSLKQAKIEDLEKFPILSKDTKTLKLSREDEPNFEATIHQTQDATKVKPVSHRPSTKDINSEQISKLIEVISSSVIEENVEDVAKVSILPHAPKTSIKTRRLSRGDEEPNFEANKHQDQDEEKKTKRKSVSRRSLNKVEQTPILPEVFSTPLKQVNLEDSEEFPILPKKSATKKRRLSKGESNLETNNRQTQDVTKEKLVSSRSSTKVEVVSNSVQHTNVEEPQKFPLLSEVVQKPRRLSQEKELNNKLSEDQTQDITKVEPRIDTTNDLEKSLCKSSVKSVMKPRRLSLERAPNIQLRKRQNRSKSLDKFNLSTSFTEPPVLLPEVVTTEIQEAATLTLTPVKNQAEDLPGSPVTCDTPDRTNELLNNTSDISPISSETHECTTPPILAPEVPNLRAAKLLQMVQKPGKRWLSPSKSRVRKIKMRKEENLDILTFSREIPSPLTVPASGILKRKLTDDVATPSPKRKRVNFPDPAITEKKIFIKDSEEFEEDNDKKPDTSALEHDEWLFTFNDYYASQFADSDKAKKALSVLVGKMKPPDVLQVVVEQIPDCSNALSLTKTIDTQSVTQEIEGSNCDIMRDLLESFVAKLGDDVRNKFLIDLMSFVSSKLPVNKEFVNAHVNILQQFLQRMTD